MILEQLFNEIEEDHLSGASTLTKKSAKIFKHFLISQRGHNKELYIELLEIGKKLIAIRPHMACIINLVDDLLYLFKKSDSILQCASFLDSIQSPQVHSYEMAAKELSEFNTLLTHSYSSSAFSLILALKNFIPDLNVIVTESRPLNEGVRLAEDLYHERVKVSFVTDAASLTAFNRADFLLLGSDFIAKQSFSNKVGSLALALGAKQFRKPLYVVADATKYIPCKNPILHMNEFPGEEVIEEEEFHIENPYFEPIPTKFIKKFLTPQGSFSMKSAKQQIFKKHLHCKSLIKNLLP